jgi:hypothetical protein
MLVLSAIRVAEAWTATGIVGLIGLTLILATAVIWLIRRS